MKDHPMKRGRPRSFEPAEVLPHALHTFLRHGYSGASIDALATAMGLNKPSLYAAFGDKRQLFQRVLDERISTLARRYQEALARGDTLEGALRELFLEAVDVYTEEQRGCVVVSAAVTEAVVDESLAAFTRAFFERTDRGLALALARLVPANANPVSATMLGRLGNAVIHDIALRARVGEPKTKLRAFARDSATVLARAAG